MEESKSKSLASQLFTSYLESTEENEYHLYQAIATLDEYAKENECKIDSGTLCTTDKYDATVNYLSQMADWLFVSREFSLCCLLLEAALKLQSNSIVHWSDIDHSIKMSLLLKLGSSNLQQGNTKEAIDNAMVSLRGAVDTQNKLLEVQSCIIIANASQRSRNFVESIYYNTKLLDIGRQISTDDKDKLDWNNQLECRVLWNISACYSSINDVHNALTYAKEYLNTVKFGSQENMTNIYKYVGNLFYKSFQYEEAVKMHEMELAICKRFNDRVGMGYAYGSIGLAYAAMQRKPLAREFLGQQFRIAKSVANSDLLLQATQNQAESYVLVSKETQAIENYKSLLKLAKENHFWKTQCIAYKSIGKLYQKQGFFNFASFFLEEGMNRANECGMIDEGIDAQTHLAQVLKILGYYEKSRSHFKDVIIHFEKLLSKRHHYEILPSSDLLLTLEGCCKDFQDVLVKLNRHDEALEIAELCRSRAFFNVLRRRNAKQDSETDSVLPLTISQMEKILLKQPNGNVVLYYAVSGNGYFLWMIRPQKGIVKFVSHHSMTTRPLESLVRRCIRSLATTKRGNRCCYESEYRRKELGLIGVKRPQIVAERTHEMVKETDHSEEGDVQPELRDIASDKTGHFAQGYESSFDYSGPEPASKVSPSLLISPTKIQKEATYDSGYGSSVSRDLQSTDQANTDKQTFRLIDTDCLPISQINTMEANEEALEQQQLLHELFDILLGHVEHLLDLQETKQVIVIAEGILNLVPYHLLLDQEKRPMHAKFKMSTSPCLAALSTPTTKHCTAAAEAVVFGNASLTDASITNINGDSISHQSEAAEEELNVVSKVLGVRAFAGNAASKERFAKVLPGAEVVHVSAVGCDAEGCLLLKPNSHRQLSIAEGESYVFGLNDLSRLDLNAKLVVLSGCGQCPHGLAQSTDFRMNLAAGFLAAGADAVVTFLYTMPHKIQLYLLHQFYRNLEMGKSVSQSLQCIYNELDLSERLSHPGYWGGIIHVGSDVCIDVKRLRRKALEKAIDAGSGLVRDSVCLKEASLSFEEFNLGRKAETLQNLLASLLSIKENTIALESLQSLISLTITQMRKFVAEPASSQLPPVKINSTIASLKPMDNILRFLGYRIEPSLEDADILFVMLPALNFDELLEMVLGLVNCLHSLRSLSINSTFHLSKCLADFDENMLITLHNTMKDLLENPEQKIYVSDHGVCRLWVNDDCRQFLESIGWYEIEKTIFIRSGCPFDEMQKIAQDLVIVLLKMCREGEKLLKKITCTQVKKDLSWFSRKATKDEIKRKNLLAKRLYSAREKFDGLKKGSRWWHESTLKSWNLSKEEIVHIGPEKEETERCQRTYFGQVKVKVKPGGTPSSCRLPLIQKNDVTKYDRYRQRETLQTTFSSNRKDLSRRRQLEITQSFKAMES